MREVKVKTNGWIFKHVCFYFRNLKSCYLQDYCKYFWLSVLAFVFSYHIITTIPFATVATGCMIAELIYDPPMGEYLSTNEFWGPIYKIVMKDYALFFIPQIVISFFISVVIVIIAPIIAIIVGLLYLGAFILSKISDSSNFLSNSYEFVVAKKNKYCPVITYYEKE